MPELVFKGKEYAYNHHLTVPYRPLLPDAGRSLGRADMAGNLIVHGDNLHALKSLLPRYAGGRWIWCSSTRPTTPATRTGATTTTSTRR